MARDGLLTSKAIGQPLGVAPLGVDGKVPEEFLPTSTLATVTLGATFATNQAFRFVDGLAQPVTSLDANMPLIDGITLESGVASSSVPVAMVVGALYSTPLAIPDAPILFLGQDGRPTLTPPTSLAGDVWYVAVMRRFDSGHFVYAPSFPILLS